jgi:uncharacterized membrane protein YcaP (DUF421 family)
MSRENVAYSNNDPSSRLPQPPEFSRKLKFARLQLIGMPLIILIPILALANQFDSVLGDGQSSGQQIVIHIVIIYLVIMVGLRVLGKREFGQLSPLELVTLLLIPEIVAPIVSGEEDHIALSLIGLATLFSVVFLMSLLTHRSKQIEKILVDEPTVLVSDGKLIEDHLNVERITPDELFAEMHKSGVDMLKQVRWAILESDGKISIVSVDQSSVSQAGQQDVPAL